MEKYIKYFTRGSSSFFESDSSKSEPQSTGVLVASSQFSNDSFITYLDQVFTSTTTPASAFSKFSHTLTICTSTTVASKTSDIFNSSSLSIPLIHLFCSKVKIAGLHYNQLTQITSIFGDPSSDSRLIRSNWISTNITTLASSISKIAHIIATKSLIDSPTSIQTDTVIVVFISSRAVTPINSNIISGPFLSTYFLFSGYKILYISSLCLIRLVRNSLGSMASSSQLSAQPAYTTLNDFTPANPPVQLSDSLILSVIF
nr:AEL_HP1_G0017600.mRNA.1.CDS.1 [Saccharomyces cerevisiae]